MTDEREPDGETTESTERIPPGSKESEAPPSAEPLPPDDEDKDEDDKADQDSKDSFPASDPPSW